MINSITMPLAGISPFTSTPNKSPQLLGLLGALGSSVIGGISNLISGNQQVKAQKQINAQQIALQREQMDLQQKQFQQQMDYQTMDWNRNRQAALEDWQRETEYNDPGAQMARYSAAGLNPYLMMQGQNAAIGSMESTAGGSSPSPGSMPGIPNLQAPDYTTLGRSVGDAAQQFFAMRIQSEQAEQLSIDNSTRMISNMLDIQNKIADIDDKLSNSDLKEAQRDNLLAQRDIYVEDLRFMRSTFDDRKKGIRRDNAVKRVTAYKLQKEGEYQEMTNKIFEEFGRDQALANLNLTHLQAKGIAQDIIESSSRINLNNANANKAIQEAAESIARKNGLPSQDTPAGRSALALIRSQIYDNSKSSIRGVDIIYPETPWNYYNKSENHWSNHQWK